MGSRELTATLGLPAEATSVMADYLSTLDAALRLPRRERTRILTETADTLACEVETAVAAGHSPALAAHDAVSRFGTPRLLAGQFAAAIMPGMARRTGLGLIISGPLIGGVWLAAAGHGPGLPARIVSVLDMAPVLPLLLAFTIACAVFAIAAGRRRLRAVLPVVWAWRAARLAAAGCVVADAVLLTAAAGQLAGTPIVAIAALLSAMRLTAAATAWRRLWRLRVAGY
ncbi:hypothetical protein [Catelliglobosispora koreensis]|uniref:hypothetical protein n=1 Tax=Catelliglobosispora koreensis TaxID=129052 RepID=UPI00037E34B6|nr:hypothetical protein [Catelliglobosispora koreensis]